MTKGGGGDLCDISFLHSILNFAYRMILKKSSGTTPGRGVLQALRSGSAYLACRKFDGARKSSHRISKHALGRTLLHYFCITSALLLYYY